MSDLDFRLVSAVSDDAVAAVSAYFDELDRRFPDGFDPGDALTADAEHLAPPGGAFVVAYLDDRPVACGGVQALGEGIGEIKRMWVDPSVRGRGLGRRMLEHLEDVAAGLGHRIVRLDTNSVLTQAIAMYESAGYVQVERYNDNPYARHWFEKALPTG